MKLLPFLTVPLFTLLFYILEVAHFSHAAVEPSLIGTLIASESWASQATELLGLVAQELSPPRPEPARSFGRLDALYSIATVYVEAGALPQAQDIATRLNSSYPLRDKLLFNIAQAYASQQQFSEALNTAKVMKQPEYQAEALAHIAMEYAEAGQSDAASATFAQALQLARRISDLPTKANALSAIAAQYDNQGQTAPATVIFAEIEALLQNLADDSCQTSGQVSQAVTRLALIGQSERALQFAQSLTPCRRIQAQQTLAQNYARTGQLSDAIAQMLQE